MFKVNKRYEHNNRSRCIDKTKELTEHTIVHVVCGNSKVSGMVHVVCTIRTVSG